MTGKLIKLVLVYTVVVLACVHSSFGADITITSTASPLKLSINQRLTVTVTITGKDANKAGVPVIKQTTDFSLAGRPGKSTQFEYNNGVSSHMISYIYTYIPNKIGTFEIGRTAVTDGKNTYTAPGTTVIVTGESEPQTEIPSEANANIFIRTSVDKEDPYVGEQVTLTFELFNRSTIWGDTEYDPPTTTGFWTVALPKIPPSTKVMNNKLYHYNAIKNALFPTTSGELTIGSSSLDYSTGGFFSMNRTQVLNTRPITIKVKPLPGRGKPQDFSGAVGDYRMSAKADRASIKVGDVVTIVVGVSGKGNLDLVSSIKAPDLSSFKTYDPKVSDAVRNSGFVVGGGKTWEYILMPTAPGKTTIQPFSLSFFNPDDASYHTVSTQPITINVTPGELVSTFQGGTGDNRNAVQQIANDINFIKPDKSLLAASNRQLHTNKIFYLFYILPLTIFTAAFAVKRRRDTIERNTGLKRKLTAWKKAQKRMEQASQLKDNGEKAAFCGKLSESITEFIGDRMNIDTGAMTTVVLMDTLILNGIDTKLAELTTKTLELYDFFRFSSTGSESEIQDKLLHDTQDILERLKDRL